MLAHVLGRAQERPERGVEEPRAEADAANARRRQQLDARPARQREHVDGFRDRRADGADVLDVAQSRRIQHVGARLVERLQPLDRVVEIAPAVQVVLGARRQRERERESRRGLDGSRDALDSLSERIDRLARLRRRVLDRAADQAGRRGAADGLGDAFRVVAEPVLEIAVDGRSVTPAITAACSSASSRVTADSPSRRPRL